MKKVGRPLWALGGVGVDTHDVQDVRLRYAVLVDQLVDPRSPLEGSQHGLQSHPPWAKIGAPKLRFRSTTTSAWRYFGRRMTRAHGSSWKSMRCKYESKISLNTRWSLRTTTSTSTSSFGSVTLVFGVVIEHFSAVGKELAGSEDMLDPELVAKAIEGRPDALKRYPSSTNGGEYVALGETDERDGNPAVEGHGGDDGIANYRRPPPSASFGSHAPRSGTSMRGRRGDGLLRLPSRAASRNVRHCCSWPLILAPMNDASAAPRQGLSHCSSVSGLAGDAMTAPGVADGWVMSARRRSGSTTQGPASCCTADHRSAAAFRLVRGLKAGWDAV
jgi:hypothetical protein